MKISELEKLNDMEKKNWWYKNRRTVITNFLSGLSFEKILDYGCGTGATTSSLKKFGAVLGTDRSKFAMEKANSNGIETINFDSINSSEFSKLKEHEEKYGFAMGQKNKFFYLGKKNKWENLLNDKIEKKVRERFNKEMKELEYI